MRYSNIHRGIFKERLNRFIAMVEIDGVLERVHVKNTGRCKEILVPDAEVWLVKSDNPERSTMYDLAAVRKGERIINIDSAAPNAAAGEWLRAGTLAEYIDIPGDKQSLTVTAEQTFGNSRFDFHVTSGEQEFWIEVKGVTLERDNFCIFPDAPSERAVKHLRELEETVKAGCQAIVLFVIQMEDVVGFAANRETHPEFADALLHAAEHGVRVMAMECSVTEDTMEITRPVPVYTNLLETIPDRLLRWYEWSKRNLPWRRTPDAYRVWISEIMLQQTRVEAVIPYYERFLEELPTVRHLAEVEDERLMKLWEGLGYYSRARNLKKAAMAVAENFGGKLPLTSAELSSLPGIGAYTAGAVASIAGGEPVPAVDGNVLRVLSRYRADARPITKEAVKREIGQELLSFMPKDRPGAFNQAMMDLGATVCLPNGAPLCEKCPLNTLCVAHQTDTWNQYPVKEEKKARRIEKRTVLILRDGDRVAVHKRPAKGLLAGLYEFPSFDGYLGREEVLAQLEAYGLHALHIRKLPAAKHVFSHVEWHMIGYDIRVDELEPAGGKEMELLYARPETLEEKYPIPSAFRAFTDQLHMLQGASRIQGL